MFDELIAEVDLGFGVGWAFRRVAQTVDEAGVLGSAADDVQVQLRHEIANRAEIDLGTLRSFSRKTDKARPSAMIELSWASGKSSRSAASISGTRMNHVTAALRWSSRRPPVSCPSGWESAWS